MRAAIAFLTILPVGRAVAPVGRSTLLAFPIAGAVVAVAWVGAAALGLWGWGVGVAAALVLVADLIVTGALHHDAVADVADALGSRRPAATVREVLADPRVGGIGAAALVVVGLLRFGLLADLLVDLPLVLLVAIPVIGRAAMVVALATMPDGDGSLATRFVAPARGVTGASVALVAVVTAALLGSVGPGPLPGATAAVAAMAVAGVAALAWRRRYGFPSGDLAGAAGVLAETVALLVLTV